MLCYGVTAMTYLHFHHVKPRSLRLEFCTERLEPRCLLSTTIYVDINALGPVHDGTSWQNAYADLQQALLNTATGDQVRVADGTYVADATGGRDETFTLKRGISVLGGYAGLGAPNPDARDPQGTPSLLNISHYTAKRTVSGSDLYDTLFDGFTLSSAGFGAVCLYIQNGAPTINNCTFIHGMGLESVNASPTITNCHFNSLDGDDGGGMTLSSSEATITDCQFINCFGREGGAWRAQSSNLVVTRCTFTSNNAAHEGQAMFNTGTDATFTDCSFTRNGDGSDPDIVIYNDGGAFTFTRCSFTENNGGPGWGGAITSYSSQPLTLTDCTFLRNYAGYAGAAIYSEGTGAVSMLNCLFQGHNTYGYGGAIDVISPEIRLTNCVFSGNQVSEHGGGAAYLANGAATITNCTFSGNTVERGAGGALMLDNVALDLRNSILAGDSAVDGKEIYVVPSGTSSLKFDHSIVGAASASGPFMRLPDPGPDGYYGSADDDYGDLRPTLRSGAVDGGDNFLVPSGVITDIAGNPRFVDIFHNGAIVDMGAYERQLPLKAIAGSYLFDRGDPQFGYYLAPAVGIRFDSDLDYNTVQTSDLVLLDPVTNLPVPGVSFQSSGYYSDTRAIVWNIAGKLPDGNYRARLAAGSVSDLGGNPLSADFTFDFFVLSGDANRDRKIDGIDLGILSANWQGMNKSFSQGDFNYDGKVDINDLYILASKWQQRLPPPPPAAAPVSAGRAPTRTATRVVNLIQ
jgi:predicted outer membrane repeat protein